MTKPEVLIVGGARTPMTDYVGALKDVSAIELGAIAARGAFERTGVRPEWIDHAVVGNVLLELRRRGKKRGLATACIGGGQGIAAIVEVA
jgi:acetyl-CoA acetyltransferase